jgi:hypothetical protein
MTVGAVRASRPQVLVELSHRLEAHRRSVTSLVELVLWRRPTGNPWSGAASSAAAERYAGVIAALGRLAASIAATSQALSHAAVRLLAALELVDKADRRAAAAGAWVDHDGQLFLPVRVTTGDPVLDAHLLRLDELMRAEVTAYLAEAVRVAAQTDAQLAAGLLAAARGGPASRHSALAGSPAQTPGRLPVISPPPASNDLRAAFAASAWWRSLTTAERDRATVEHPEWVGPRDGLPASARHEANLLLLARAEDVAVGDLRRAEETATPWNATERTRARERLDDLRALRELLARPDAGLRRLLRLDTSEPNIRAGVSVGDVEHAEHVATFVGGMSTTVRGDVHRYDDVFRGLREAARAMAPGEDVAIVTWMGYNAPQTTEIITSVDRNVLNAKVARDNADALAAFVTGLEAARDRPVHQTVWAHSYGAVLTGFAMLRTSAIDDVVVFGAPGLPFSHLASTGLKPGALNVLGALADDVVDYGWVAHGTRAADVVGAVRLSTFAAKERGQSCNQWLRPRSDFVDVRRTSVGHSDYLRPGTDSAHNLAAVAAGRRDQLIHQTPEERACTTTGPNAGLLDPLRWPRLLP